MSAEASGAAGASAADSASSLASSAEPEPALPMPEDVASTTLQSSHNSCAMRLAISSFFPVFRKRRASHTSFNLSALYLDNNFAPWLGSFNWPNFRTIIPVGVLGAQSASSSAIACSMLLTNFSFPPLLLTRMPTQIAFKPSSLSLPRSSCLRSRLAQRNPKITPAMPPMLIATPAEAIEPLAEEALSAAAVGATSGRASSLRDRTSGSTKEQRCRASLPWRPRPEPRRSSRELPRRRRTHRTKWLCCTFVVVVRSPCFRHGA
mmetsp:Transcript_11121/g.29858  ORF Transcript_11121/g.29858 Transcript_11121/m.29858 type:complete len:263 (+) Transcript_11121:501-1289(+)